MAHLIKVSTIFTFLALFVTVQIEAENVQSSQENPWKAMPQEDFPESIKVLEPALRAYLKRCVYVAAIYGWAGNNKIPDNSQSLILCRIVYREVNYFIFCRGFTGFSGRFMINGVYLL